MPPIFNRKRLPGEDEDDPFDNQDVWVKIDKTVRHVDEEKIKDCTDDIDTLLVFAGLYSAVLTAFLIESYKTLTADPTDTLLQQLVSQSANYRFTGGFLNTTFDISQLPSFEIPTSAIRVNVCWFASLVISLSTASYGILVKQWLREYLSIDRTAAHERLRVRHFRKQGLETWKLYDIAAILPMFLQLSLILFLVGLCFFTASVHESIGHTTLVPVCAWAFFLALAILAPLVSARCPYKTSFLKAVFRHLRPHAHSFAHKAAKQLLWVATPLYSYLIPTLSTISHRCLDHLARLAATTVQPCWRLLRAMFRTDSNLAPNDDPGRSLVTPQPGEALTYDNHEDSIRDNNFHLEYMILFAETTLEDPTNFWREESTLRSDERSDPVVFRDIDSIFLDDGLLATMRKALQRRPPPGEEVFKSVIGILQHRSDLVFRNLDGQSAVPTAWPWALSTNARTTLVDILTDSLTFEIAKTSVFNWYYEITYRANPKQFWMNQALSLVFALSAGDSNLPQSMSSALEGWLRDRVHLSMIYSILAFQLKVGYLQLPRHISIKWQAHVFTLLLAVLKLLPTEDAARAFRNIVWHSYGDFNKLTPADSPQRTDELPLVIAHQDGEEVEPAQDAKVSPLVVLTLMDVAAGILTTLTVAPADKPNVEEPEHIAAFPESVEDLLDFVFQAIPFIQKTMSGADLQGALLISRVNLKAWIWVLFTAPTPCCTRAFLNFWSTHSADLNSQLRPGQFLHVTVNPQDNWQRFPDKAATEFLSTCASYFSSKISAETPLELPSVIQLCHLVYLASTSGNGEVLRAWHTVFASVIKCIDHVSPDPGVQGDQEGKLPQCEAGDHTDTCSAAAALLAALDLDQNDGKRSYRCLERRSIFETTWSPKPDRETAGYSAWQASFKVEEAQMPDDMVKTLLRFICGAHNKDDEGRMFWRVRRLQELEAHQSHVETTTTSLAEETTAGEEPLAVVRTHQAQPSYAVSVPIIPLNIINMPTGSVATAAAHATPASPASPTADSHSPVIHPSSTHAPGVDFGTHNTSSRGPPATPNLPADRTAHEEVAAVAPSPNRIDIVESAPRKVAGKSNRRSTDL